MKEALISLLLVILVFAIQTEGRFQRSYRRADLTSAICKLPPAKGDCRASFERWYFDEATRKCKTFTWGGCGGNENRFWSETQCESTCLGGTPRFRRCRLLPCSKRCPYGYMTDGTGCRLCACKPDPSQANCPELECPNNVDCHGHYKRDEKGCELCECACPLFMCLMDCKYGLAKDERGCGLCKCNEEPICPAISCLLHCEFGKKKDEKGCEICQCLTKAEVCGEIQCSMECPGGFMKDRRGCEICRCRGADYKRIVCARLIVSCRNTCAYGRAKDNSACPTCTCNPHPVAEEEKPAEVDCTHGQPAVGCRMYCPHGYKKDNAGCELCECADPPTISLLPARLVKTECRSTPQGCKKTCAFGYHVDAQGCKTCQCRSSEDPHVEHHGQACEDIRATCRMTCTRGFARDERGCEICKCFEPTAGVLPASISRARVDCSKKPQCLMFCVHGKKEEPGPDGCDSCECKDAPSISLRPAAFFKTDCLPFVCATDCAFGYQLDSHGCKTCQCSSSDDPHVEHHGQACEDIRATCRMTCTHGFARDERGCEICKCSEAAPGILPASVSRARVDCSNGTSCYMYCAHGFKKRSDGCDICECRDAPSISLRPAGFFKTDCPPFDCTTDCAFGYQLNSHGCKTCQCRSSARDDPSVSHHQGPHVEHHGQGCPNIRVTCTMHCGYGFVRDNRGCEICSCAQQAGAVAASARVDCSQKRTCRMHCERGFRKGPDGCDICECL